MECGLCGGEVKGVGGEDPETGKTHALDICQECGAVEGPVVETEDKS